MYPFDAGVLPWLAGLDASQGDALLLGPGRQRRTAIFRPVVGPDRQRLPAPFGDLDDPFGRQREIHFDPQFFAVEVIQHVQKSDLPSVGQAIDHEPKIREASCMDQVMFGAFGLDNASGFSRFSRCRGLIRRFRSSAQQIRRTRFVSSGKTVSGSSSSRCLHCVVVFYVNCSGLPHNGAMLEGLSM